MRNRLIPVLLLDRDRRLVKTVEFDERTYIGDPFNVVRLFNEKEVDEICVLDIDATCDGRDPDQGFLRELAAECFMPLAYGGGVRNLNQCESLSRLGIEKFVLGTSALDLEFVRAACGQFGSQAVVGCVDLRGGIDGECYTRSGIDRSYLLPRAHCTALQEAGVGEIILQSIDRDGLRTGFDLELIRILAAEMTIPVIALGGAGNYSHLEEVLAAGASAAASGSAFAFIGRLRAVLVNYPDRAALGSE